MNARERAEARYILRAGHVLTQQDIDKILQAFEQSWNELTRISMEEREKAEREARAPLLAMIEELVHCFSGTDDYDDQTHALAKARALIDEEAAK